MKKAPLKALIISISSDIGYALATRWRKRGMEVAGTYRRASGLTDDLKLSGVRIFHCDVASAASVRRVCARLRRAYPQWNYLVLCPGTLQPVGAFTDSDFAEWQRSVEVNFIRQMQFVRELLPSRSKIKNHPPVVVFFAGGGTNNATVNYSAYTISKIALIKMCELLDAEIPDTNFVILGPGWVKTKIHQETLQAGQKAGANYPKTLDRIASDKFTPMERVLDCCDWAVAAPRKAAGGRNFSVVFDKWGTSALIKKLLADPDMYKLRRYRN